MTDDRSSIRDYRDVVDNIEVAWIPMQDGRKLAARLLLPKDAHDKPAPAILEYIPYRRRDGTRARDDETHYWFAAHGYACARVDIAGSGDSEGLIEDEYVRREQDDALDIIAWLSAQAWCSGSVGMIGISWGGFNALQVAARRPPALKAVIALCATVDRYHDDVHFMGGCLLNDTIDWGGFFFAYGALPPDPQMVGEDRWRALWRQRIDNLELYPALWMRHQRRDGFWKHGSVIEDYDAIQCPVLVSSGWADGYTAAVFRLVENLEAPCKGIVGPWGHKYPHVGVPGPAIGFLTEAKRWWDRWLKGIETGVENDPPLRLWLQGSVRPQPHFDTRPGRWIGLPAWPAKTIKPRALHFSGATLSARKRAKRGKPRAIRSPLTTGLGSGEWCAYALGKIAPELPLDQREDDSGSLLFEAEPLKGPLAIVGGAVARLRVAADKPQAMIAVRLNAVHPDGTVERITYGLLNLSHRDSHERPSPLETGQFYDVKVKFKDIAQVVPAGHRLRVAVSTGYWPLAWPSPELATVSIDPKHSAIEIPVLASMSGLRPVKFGAPERVAPMPVTIKEPGAETRHASRDIESERTSFVIERNDGAFVIDDTGTQVSFAKRKDYSLKRDDPESAKSLVACTAHYRRSTWDARVETAVVMTADRKSFHLEATLKAFDGDALFAERAFKDSFKRDNV